VPRDDRNATVIVTVLGMMCISNRSFPPQQLASSDEGGRHSRFIGTEE
jgi:hypothetical protein